MKKPFKHTLAVLELAFLICLSPQYQSASAIEPAHPSALRSFTRNVSEDKGAGKPVPSVEFARSLKRIEDLSALSSGNKLLREAYASRGFIGSTSEPWQKLIDSDILQRSDSADVLCSIVQDPSMAGKVSMICDWLRRHPDYTGGAAVRKAVTTRLIDGTIPADIEHISTIYGIAYMLDATGNRDELPIMDWMLNKFPEDIALMRAKSSMLKRLANSQRNENTTSGNDTASNIIEPTRIKERALPIEKVPVATPWLTWGVVIASAIGLLWLVLKRRK